MLFLQASQPTQDPTKWSALRDVFVSTNGIILSVLLFAIFILLLVSIKKGIISFKGFGVTVGINGEAERNIIRQQVEWTNIFLSSFVKDLSEPGLDEWRTKYVIERIYDEVVDWITFNHITDRGDYIRIKQDKVWYLIKSLTEKERFESPEFHNTVNEVVRVIITQLIKIREVYSKKL